MVAISESGVPCTLEMAPCGHRDRWEEHYRIGFDGGLIQLDLPAPMARQRAGDVTIYKNTGFGSQEYARNSPCFAPVLGFFGASAAFCPLC